MSSASRCRRRRPSSWDAFRDVPLLVECLPGASLTGAEADGALPLRFDAKLGPIAGRIRGQGPRHFDDAARAGRFEGSAADARTQSRVRGVASFRVESEGETSLVVVGVDYALTGSLAQLGRGGIVRELANALTAQFAARLAARLPQAAVKLPEPSAMSAMPPRRMHRSTRARCSARCFARAGNAFSAGCCAARRPDGGRRAAGPGRCRAVPRCTASSARAKRSACRRASCCMPGRRCSIAAAAAAAALGDRRDLPARRLGRERGRGRRAARRRRPGAPAGAAARLRDAAGRRDLVAHPALRGSATRPAAPAACSRRSRRCAAATRAWGAAIRHWPRGCASATTRSRRRWRGPSRRAGPIALWPLAAGGLAHGDDLHSRTASANDALAAQLRAHGEPTLADHVAATPLFFLTLWMAASSLILRAAEGGDRPTLVTRGGGNGERFGIALRARRRTGSAARRRRRRPPPASAVRRGAEGAPPATAP